TSFTTTEPCHSEAPLFDLGAEESAFDIVRCTNARLSHTDNRVDASWLQPLQVIRARLQSGRTKQERKWALAPANSLPKKFPHKIVTLSCDCTAPGMGQLLKAARTVWHSRRRPPTRGVFSRGGVEVPSAVRSFPFALGLSNQ